LYGAVVGITGFFGRFQLLPFGFQRVHLL
jgi:hypothetical protein